MKKVTFEPTENHKSWRVMWKGSAISFTHNICEVEVDDELAEYLTGECPIAQQFSDDDIDGPTDVTVLKSLKAIGPSKLTELGSRYDVAWQTLLPIMKRLVESGQVRKSSNIYEA
tara:strand:- start:381 stop:725 length:345 start_codon:yes stop_codon:yes gene_type:complete